MENKQPDKEKEKKVEAFLQDIDAVYQKHQLSLAPELHVTAQGIVPRLNVYEISQKSKTDGQSDTSDKKAQK